MKNVTERIAAIRNQNELRSRHHEMGVTILIFLFLHMYLDFC